jgi:hypothetical protein
MGKLTWKFLGEIFEGQFKITPTEAADVLYRYLFTDTSWKGRLDKKRSINEVGQMWKDDTNKAAFMFILNKEKELKEKIGRASVRKLYDSPEFDFFCQTCGLVYKKYSNGLHRFQKDKGMWLQQLGFVGKYKRNKMFSRARKRIAKRQAKLEKVFEDGEQKRKEENISRSRGIQNRKALIASGEWEEVKSGLRKIQK